MNCQNSIFGCAGFDFLDLLEFLYGAILGFLTVQFGEKWVKIALISLQLVVVVAVMFFIVGVWRRIVKKLFVLMLFVLFAQGCNGFKPGSNPNFWTQCVKIDGWGFSGVTAYGPWNLGKVTYERNVACDKDVKPNVAPSVPTTAPKSPQVTPPNETVPAASVK